MAFNKKFFILIFIIFNFYKFAYSEIIYDKEGIIISNLDIEIYKNYYKNLYKKDINNQKSIKDIILIKKLIKRLEIKNPLLINEIDQQVNLNLKDIKFYNEDLRDYDRFLVIKNELINEYYQNNFSLIELKQIFTKIDNLNIALSTNNCLTIEKVINSKEITEIPLLIYKKIKEKNDSVLININNKNYQICIDNNFYSIIQLEITEFIDKKIQKKLKEMIYG